MVVMSYRVPRGLLAASLVLAGASSASAEEGIRVERIRFERGANSAVVEASIRGYEIVDHLVGARQGQYMNVSMATDTSVTRSLMP